MRYAISGAVLVALAGCAHVPLKEGCAAFDGAAYCVQPSIYTFSLTQSVEIAHPKGSDKLLVYLDAKDGDITMVGLTPFGQRVMQIRFDADGVHADLPTDAALRAEHILAGLQLAAWPLEQARAGVVRGQLVQTTDPRRRELRVGDTVVYRALCEGERPVCRRAELIYETLDQTVRIELLEENQ